MESMHVARSEIAIVAIRGKIAKGILRDVGKNMLKD